MSQIIEKLKQVSRKWDLKKKTDPTDSYEMMPDFTSTKKVTIPWTIFFLILGSWMLTMVFAAVLIFSNGFNRIATVKSISQIVKRQTAEIKNIETGLAELNHQQKESAQRLETQQRKYIQVVDGRIKDVDSHFAKMEKQISAGSVDSLNQEVLDLRISLRGMIDKVSDLSSEVKTLKLLTAEHSAPNLETGRN